MMKILVDEIQKASFLTHLSQICSVTPGAWIPGDSPKPR